MKFTIDTDENSIHIEYADIDVLDLIEAMIRELENKNTLNVKENKRGCCKCSGNNISSTLPKNTAFKYLDMERLGNITMDNMFDGNCDG
jgi:hypothetical protein